MENQNKEEFKVDDLISKIDFHIEELEKQHNEQFGGKTKEEIEEYYLEELKNALIVKELNKIINSLMNLEKSVWDNEELFFKIVQLFRGKSYIYNALLEELQNRVSSCNKEIILLQSEKVKLEKIRANINGIEDEEEMSKTSLKEVEKMYEPLLNDYNRTKELILLLQKNDIQPQYDKWRGDIEKSNGMLASMFADSLENYKSQFVKIDNDLKLIDNLIKGGKND